MLHGQAGVVRPEDSTKAQSESIGGRNQTGVDVCERMVDDEGEVKDFYD